MISRSLSAIIIFSLLLSLAAAQPPKSPGLNSLGQSETRTQTDDGGFKAKYVLSSLVLPGSGEWLAGHKNMAKFFFGTELALWAGYIGARAYANVLEDNFQAYAAVHAGIQTTGKGQQYWIDIGSADNIYEFNEQQRVLRNLEGTYRQEQDYFWQWDTPENRRRYSLQRIRQHDWERRATFVISGLILNRIISAIDVIRILRKDKKNSAVHQSRLFFDYKQDRLQGDIFRLNMTFRW
ncbi:MAG: hypothetical protein WAN36_02500 [Calditrichia bacterium]